MYSEIKKDENPLQSSVTAGKEKPDNEKSEAVQTNEESECCCDECNEIFVYEGPSKPKLSFNKTNSHRWYYQTRSRKTDRY
jgi:hypothetical protein